jgi:Glycine cleavage system regulatory protein
MTNQRLILTVFAKDRPGIIGEISDVVLARQGNWLESSLSRLCGLFTGIVHLEVQQANKETLLAELSKLSDSGINIQLHEQASSQEDDNEINGLQIVVEANDRAGIIKEIADALIRENINIDNIDTEVESASMAGYPIFRAHLFLALPDDVQESDLEQILEAVSDDLMVSIVE